MSRGLEHSKNLAPAGALPVLEAGQSRFGFSYFFYFDALDAAGRVGHA